MKSNGIGSLIFLTFFISGTSQAESVPVENVGGNAVCGGISEEVRLKSEAISKRYQDQISQRTAEIQEQSNRIKNDAPKPEAVEAALNFDIEVKNRDQELLFDLPEVIIKDQRMSLDLPQVTMKRKDMSFDNPTLVMRTTCTPGVPEVVCEEGSYRDSFGIRWPKLDCRTRAGADICLDTPHVEMRRVDFSMDVPETAMGRTEWVMGIPEFTMKTQRIVLGIPEITIKNVRAEVQKAAEAGNDLSNKARGEMEALSASLKEEISANAASGISDTFSCQRTAFENKIKDAVSQIDNHIAVVQKSLQEARERKVSDLAASLEKSEKQLLEARQNLLAKRDTELNKMIESERIALDKAVQNDLKELKT